MEEEHRRWGTWGGKCTETKGYRLAAAAENKVERRGGEEGGVKRRLKLEVALRRGGLRGKLYLRLRLS